MQKNSYNKLVPFFTLCLFLGACKFNAPGDQGPLPILGEAQYVEKNTPRGVVVDTIYHTIPAFEFVDQDSQIVNLSTFDNTIYVSDFFFTSCPTICPVMTIQMHRMYKALTGIQDVAFLSHSIDPQRDSVARLKAYANKIGTIDANRWHFVTGGKDEIYYMAKAYFENASADPNEPGGYAHSGYFYLVDKQKRIRGMYLGTKEEQVDQLILDIRKLRNE